MSTLLQHLNNESILLMYLAGELPAEDGAEVEQMLAGDERLRDELERLRAAYEGVGAALADADAAERLALTPPVAARRVGQAARAWYARRLAAPPAGHARRRLRLPRWAYGVAAAALVAIGYTAWWGLQPEAPMGRRQAVVPESQPTNFVFGGDLGSLTLEQRQMFLGPWEQTPWLYDEADAVLDDAEDDLYALLESSSDAGFTDDGSALFPGETDER